MKQNNFKQTSKKIDKRLIHDWFELTYAKYLVLPRSVLQSMPEKWQAKFVKLLDELEDTGVKAPLKGTYMIYLRDEKGKFIEDYYKDYERGRRIIKFPKGEKT